MVDERDAKRDAKAGDKIAAARAYGVDLSQTMRNMFARTVQERLLSLQEGADSLEFLRRHAKV